MMIKKLFKRISLFRHIYSSLLERKYIFLYKKDPHLAANAEYKAVFHRDINWANPTNLIEKISWLQFNTDTSLWTQCADKYRVREYISKKGYEQYLPKLYGHWDKVEDIDFGSLPNQFVFKANNGCGTVLVVKDKNKLNKKKTKKMLSKWLKMPFGYMGAQMHYLKIKPNIIAEELLEERGEYALLSPNSLVDYKIWCFHGIPECVLVVFNRTKNHAEQAVYDLNWNNISSKVFKEKYYENDLPKPINFEKMIEYAKVLSENIPEVRVDFYIIEGKIYFGEMTFTAGYGDLTDEYYSYLGSKINLNN